MNGQLVGGAAIGGFAGVGGAVAITNIKSSVTSYADKGSTLSAGGALNVTANFTDNVEASAYGGAAGFVGLGAQVAIVNDSASQSAYLASGDSASNKVTISSGGLVTISAGANRTYSVNAKGLSIGAIAAGAAIAQVNSGGTTAAYAGNYSQVGHLSSGIPTVSGLTISANSVINATASDIASAGGIGSFPRRDDANIEINPTIQAYTGSNAT